MRIVLSLASFVKVRLTVSMVRPRKSAMSWRLMGSGTVTGTAKLRPAVAHVEQEADELLLGGASAEQHHLILREGELVGGEIVEPAQEVRFLVHERRIGRPREAAGDDRLDGVGREAIPLAHGKAKKIAREGEADDLPAAVRKDLVE